MKKNVFNAYYLPYSVKSENLKETKEKYQEIYQQANKQGIQKEDFKEYTINNIASSMQPQARLFNSFYNGMPNNKEFLYKREIYTPPVCPDHYYYYNKFSPFF